MNAAVKTLENLGVNKHQIKVVPESNNKNYFVRSITAPELERQLRLYAEAELNYNNHRRDIGTIFITFMGTI